MFLPSTNNRQWLTIKIMFLIQFDMFANAQIVPATAWGAVNTPPWPSVRWSWETLPGKDDIGKLKLLYLCEVIRMVILFSKCIQSIVPRNLFATIPICCLANDFDFVPGSDVEWTSNINRPSLPAPICKWFDPLASPPLQQVFLIVVFRRCITTGILGPDFFSFLSMIYHNRGYWYFLAFQFLLYFSKLLL